jgi:hypothetical protein
LKQGSEPWFYRIVGFILYAALKQYLEDTGFLPDEYFLLGIKWQDGRRIPRDAWIIINVDYGSNEGIYLDIVLYWNEEKEGKTTRCSENFITGKTLGESHSDLDRMHLIAAAVRKAFHTDGVHARYIMIGSGNATPSGMTTHLSAEEIALLVDSLLETRARQKAEGKLYMETERLMRRFLGGITEYMQTVGARPVGITDQDAIFLAVRENNIEVFQELLPKVPNLHHELLFHTAGQPGRIGEQMTKSLLSLVKDVPRELYLQAITQAVTIGDIPRIAMLLEGAESRTDDAEGALYSEAIEIAMHTISENIRGTYIAETLARKASSAQLAAVNPRLVAESIRRNSEALAYCLLASGIDFSNCQADLYHAVAAFHRIYLFRDLKERGGDINAENFGALRICLNHCDVHTASVLIDNGADYRGFRASIEGEHLSSEGRLFLEALDNHVALKEAEEDKKDGE